MILAKTLYSRCWWCVWILTDWMTDCLFVCLPVCVFQVQQRRQELEQVWGIRLTWSHRRDDCFVLDFSYILFSLFGASLSARFVLLCKSESKCLLALSTPADVLHTWLSCGSPDCSVSLVISPLLWWHFRKWCCCQSRVCSCWFLSHKNSNLTANDICINMLPLPTFLCRTEGWFRLTSPYLLRHVWCVCGTVCFKQWCFYIVGIFCVRTIR